MATEQEEIRKAVKTCIAIEQSCGEFDGNRLTQNILEIQDALGVVLKVDRNLPDFYWETHKLNNGKTNTVSRSIPEEIQKVYAGYEAVGPLIGE